LRPAVGARPCPPIFRHNDPLYFYRGFFAVSVAKPAWHESRIITLARKKRQLLVVWILLFDAELIAAGGGVCSLRGGISTGERVV
jgi:hypothetical protein